MTREQIIVYSATLLTAIWASFVYVKSLHMFQLNMYKNGRHFKWLWQNDILFTFRRTETKKPLVTTPRVVRLMITSGITAFGFYFAFRTFTDFNYRTLFLLPLFLFLAETLPIIANIINSPIESANNRRYIRDAKRIIDSMPNLITIGITGSYGKTSTKYYLHKLLSAKYNVLMTPESFNTTMGVVKTIRNELRPTHEIFICEMGMMWKGDIAELCAIAKPKHVMLTSIGPQHLETMKSLQNIIEEKFSITDCVTDGICFLNYDNEYINSRKIDKSFIAYGITEQATDYRATDIFLSEKGTSFTISSKHEQTADPVMFETALIGSHNVQNIVGAIAVAHKLGVSYNELLLPVKRLECAPHRLEVRAAGANIIIDDSFNSNPVGFKAALDALKAFEGTKILITPGMVELGGRSHELNKQAGVQAAEACDYALLIGQKQAPPIKEGLLEAGFPEDKIHLFDSFNAGMAFADKLQSDNRKVILIENDLPDNYT
jgi:UDP-N-acetylmuramoyl-tripeptide--D-alanyl-D-alanine ligase